MLGLGPSLELYKGGYDLTIGVNDIWSRVQTDHIVCVDEPARFTPERMETINASKPQRFYTHLDSWSHRSDIFRIELQPNYPNYICLLNTLTVPKSLCSPFVAAAVAYKFHDADEIHLYGVDLVNHPLLHPQSVIKIVLHFKHLKMALKSAGCRMVIHGEGVLTPLNKVLQR